MKTLITNIAALTATQHLSPPQRRSLGSMQKCIQYTILSFVVSVPLSASLISSEPIITNPTSTEDLWSYSYITPNSLISSSQYYYGNVGDFSGAVHQGYVTGNNTTWPSIDAFLSDSGYKESHIFETHIMSATDQTVHFGSGGDDGHSIFIDDLLMDGKPYGEHTSTDLDMLKNTPYKITLALANYTGGWHVNASLSGTDEQGDSWAGQYSNAHNISMNASGEFVPEPTTLALVALGLAGIGYRRKKSA